MEAVSPPPAAADDPRTAERRADHLLDALKAALAAPGEHRLFRWGKLPGLFPARSGPPAAAAQQAVRDGLLEITRAETKGKLLVEWVRTTPAAVAYVGDHDSPKAVLRELRDVIGATRGGVPDWMAAARDEAADLALRFERRAAELMAKLDRLTERVDAALRRADMAPTTLGRLGEVVPWGEAALVYLDRRADAGRADCPLPELFRAVADGHPTLTLPAFQDGLRRLAEGRAVRLLPADLDEPEFAFVAGGRAVGAVRR